MNEVRRNDAENSAEAGTIKIPEVAIVILNWNGKVFLEKFLPFVINSNYKNKRIIVADNASTDDSLVYLRQHYPSIELIINSKNEGFAKGYNTALKQVTSEYYILLNSDVEVTENWIGPVIDLMESDPAIAACQPKILSYENRLFFEYAGASGGWMDKFGYPFLRGRIFDNCEKDNGQYDDARPCFWASGAAFFVRANSYHAMGGMDEYFFAHQEEIDLCWRLQRAGYKIYVQPASVVYHVGGGTLPKGNNRKTYLNFRNNLIMMHKNMPFFERLWKINFRFALNEIAALKSLVQGDTGFFAAVFKAHVAYFKWIIVGPRVKRSIHSNPRLKSGANQSGANQSGVMEPGVIRSENEIAGWYDGSVVWEHFIKNKQTFSEIVTYK